MPDKGLPSYGGFVARIGEGSSLAAEAKFSARVRSSFLFFSSTRPVSLVTIRAAAQTLGRLISAAMAGVDDFDFSHVGVNLRVAQFLSVPQSKMIKCSPD